MRFSEASGLPVGYQQITALAAATGLTVPKDSAGNEARWALIQAETQAVRWRDDGTDPTGTVGFPLLKDSDFVYTGDLRKIKFIEQAASAKLNVAYYR